jgi:hypothetical protein
MKVAIVHRSYEKEPGVSHVGLGVCAINTVKTLLQHHIKAEVWPVASTDILTQRIQSDPHVTHVVIQAPWVPSSSLLALSRKHPEVQFAVNCHSNVGFLQTEPEAVTKMLELLELEQSTHNLHCAGNSADFVQWIRNAYQSPCVLLPNLYYLDHHARTHRPLWSGGLLRIGIFGAPRPQKNVLTGVAGAIELAQMLKAHTEIWVNGGRNETHGKTILEAAKRAISKNPLTTYKEFPWAPWPEFRRHIGSMSLLIQASYTESFNQVTADGIAVGVPSVISSAIRWAPSYWEADVDSAGDIARTGHSLLLNAHAQEDGFKALSDHNRSSLAYWREFLMC